MSTEIINSFVSAATTLHNLFENGEIGQFSCFLGSPEMCRAIASLEALEWLKNEYSGNMIEAAMPDKVNDYYRGAINKCKELCPYGFCEIKYEHTEGQTPWPIPEGWIEKYMKIDYKACVAAWPIMREKERGKIDSSDAYEYLCAAHSYQNDIAKAIAKLIEWWYTIEPSRTLELLAQYPKANTPEAQKYFAIAIDKGYMIETANGYEWKRPEGRGKWAALGYFLSRVYYPIPEKEMQYLFGKNRLGQAARDSATPHMLEIEKDIFGDER